MMCSALAATEMSLLDCGVKIKAGSGVGAAVEYYSQAAKPAVAKAA
jgi:alanine-glyoxylate transaminase/serine-glyoxylate transaminase/serine-pyruvate transaminase